MIPKNSQQEVTTTIHDHLRLVKAQYFTTNQLSRKGVVNKSLPIETLRKHVVPFTFRLCTAEK